LVLVEEVFVMNLMQSLSGLSLSEKLVLVEDLWDEIGASTEPLPVHEWQKTELDRRQANHTVNPSFGSSWDVVKQSIRQRNG
jgi:putative addiction module component (TIGR02574 family)